MTTVPFARTDHSALGRWWWTVDRWTLAALAAIIGFGVLLIMAASPAVAERIGFAKYYFVERHLETLGPTILVMFMTSLMTPRSVRRLAFITFAIALVLLMLTPVIGVEIKGARRWIHVPGLSIQPSEFIKPAFAVVTAWLISQQKSATGLPGTTIAVALYLLIVLCLLKQPDLGQTFVVSVVWFCQLFLAGLPIILVVALIMAGSGGLVGAYYIFPHVQSRVDRFLNPASGDTYQVQRSLEAFQNGGLWGTGPGQGTIKLYLPDAHADFVFSVAGEELGLIWCMVILALFLFVTLRCLSRARRDNTLFCMLASVGLTAQFALQAVINMGSALHLIPTKGMTLPFISYGGSSLVALGIGMGMLLALTRKRFGSGESP